MSGNGHRPSERWENLTFEQAIVPVSDEGKRVDRSDYISEGDLPVIDQGEDFIGGYANDSPKRYDGPLPVIVFGDHTRRVKLVDSPLVVGAQGVKLLRTKVCWEPRFLAYLLPTLPLPDRGYGRHYRYLRQLEFSCPPRPLQRQIVAEIEKQFTRLEAGVAGLRCVQANLKRYRAAVLKAACDGKLVPTEAELAREREKVAAACRRGGSEENQSRDGSATQEGPGYETSAQLLDRILTDRRQKWSGKGKYKQPEKPDTTNLPPLPKGWAWGSLDQICTKITDGEHLSPKTVREGVFLLSAKDVREHGVQLDDPKFVSSKDAAQFRKRCDPELGDVLIVSRGATIGRISVVQTTETFCLMGSVILIKSDKNVLGKYLAVCLRDQRAK